MLFNTFKQLLCKHHFTEYQTQHFHVAECLKCGIQFPHSNNQNRH
ncbi:hypothetical protein [Acinetobacter sp. SFB]|nr:hypothetical protein [Acinetobacter sp. SFB]